MPRLEAHKSPIDPSDLFTLSEMLRDRAVFSPTFNAPEVDLYNPAVYLHQAQCFATDTVLLVDRNVLTRVVAVARGCRVTPEHRLAAAALAFAQCAEIQIEPNIALYELASRNEQEAAREELAWFSRANEAHPVYWTSVALGRASRLGELPDLVTQQTRDLAVDFAMPLRRWKRNYVLCLKLAELELASGRAIERFRAFLRWSYDEFILAWPAIGLAAHYFAPNGERRRLLKALRSSDRNRALQGIRNAAWDVTLVSEWLRYVEEQAVASRIVLLTSFDSTVHKLARSVAAFEPTEGTESPWRIMESLWGRPLGLDLNAEIDALYANRDSPTRHLNSDPDGASIDVFIANGERAIREWESRRSP